MSIHFSFQTQHDKVVSFHVLKRTRGWLMKRVLVRAMGGV
jgi:hypothetical protein